MLRKLTCLLFIASAVLALPRPDDDSAIPPAEICLQPAEKPSPISCLAAIPKWTFNSKTSACEKYLYGGCGGTENLFDKELDCLSKCNRKALLRPALIEEKKEEAAPADEPTSKSPCLLPLAAGTCRAHITVFHFDAEAKACKSFIYTGCQGNENNFATEEDCKETCRAFLPISAVTLPAKLPEAEEKLSKQELCSLPPVKELPVSCLGFMPMWTHNSKTNKCESYVYGGCGKTANLFQSEEACNKACGPEEITGRSSRQRSDNCLLPVTSGPCFGFKPRFGFKKDKNRCEKFVYGGCQGNANNFRTAEECFDACGGNQPSTTPECERVTCPVENNRYIERGCLPVYSDNSCCPTSFDCPAEDKSVPMCHYRGVPFQVGEDVPMVTKDIPCKTHCRCEKSASHTGGATIKCMEIFCDWPRKPHDGCVLHQGPDQCCPSYKCDETPQTTKPEVCNHNGKQYNLGDYIRTGLPCKACICVPGFNGLDGPGCRDVHCLVDNRIDSVPIYTKNVCCPTGYKRNADLVGNSTTIIRRPPGRDSATTMPITVPENWQVKSKICLLPKVIGPCKKAEFSFYYDSDANECRSFIYGGCQGNDNRFDSLETCLEACRVPPATGRAIAPVPGRDSVSTMPIQIPENFQVKSKICLLPKVIGPCRAASPSFYYNSEENECQFFTYGGCHGNENRFPSKEACLEACRVPPKADGRILTVQPEPGKQGATTLPIKVSPEEVSNRCYQPKETGPCRMALEQFHYDADSGECTKFYYGGCKGNQNRFDTAESCMEACRGTPKVTRSGPFITIQEPGKQGVSTLPIMVNNLDEEREGRVISVQEPGKQGVSTLPARIPDDGGDRCQLPMIQGPCRMAIEQFYYDAEKGECFVFYYGGCKGNANRFNSPKECSDACRGVTKVERDGPFITVQEPGKQGVSTLPIRIGTETTRDGPFITVQQPGKAGASTLPIRVDTETTRDGPFITVQQPGKAGASTLPIRIDSETKRDGPFITVQEPGKAGVSTLPARISSDELTDGNICSLPQEIGPCRASVPSYSYNVETGTCESFWYGGCRGNANRFSTEEACLARCGSSSATPNVGRARSSVEPAEIKDRCQMPADVGFCRGHAERFYHDSATKECKTFIWGGCLGNANNFATKEDCLAACGSAPAGVMLLGGSAARGAARIDGGDQPMALGARARARTADPVCVFGNLTLNLGDEIHNNDDPCEVCECETPPEITCTRQTCPSAPPTSEAICEYEYVAGQCCPVISCVSANPPSINVCDGVECGADEHCEVHSQESPDGSWIPPIGVCIPNEKNCEKRACPPLPSTEDAVCSYEPVSGQCCPNIVCVPVDSQKHVDGQSCGRKACPALPTTPGALCHFEDAPGECCPRVACVPSATLTANTI